MQVTIQTFIGGISLGAIYALVAWASRWSTAPWAGQLRARQRGHDRRVPGVDLLPVDKLPFALAMAIAIA
jgi:hypothetical protein